MSKFIDEFDYQRDVAKPLEELSEVEKAYYLGYLDSITYNIGVDHHDFRIPQEEVGWFAEKRFFFNYLHFCLVVIEADNDSRCLYFRPFFKDRKYANYFVLRELYIRIFHTEDDEGVTEEGEGPDFNNWDLTIAKQIQEEVEAIRKEDG